MNIRPISLVPVTVLVCLPSAFGQITLGPATNIPTGFEPSGSAPFDLNGDGAMDLAVTVDAPDRVQVLMNNGAGTLIAGPAVLLPNSSSPEAIVAADFDMDGDMDLAISLKDFNSVILVNNQGGLLVPGTTTGTGGIEPRRMAGGDLDGDGDTDLVVTHRDSNNAAVLTNVGGLLSLTASLPAGLEPRDAAIADFDLDGDADLAVSAHDSRTIHVFQNTGAGFAAGPVLSTGFQLRPDGLTAADLDGDGDAELVAATSGNGLNFVSVYTNTAGAFAGPANFASGGLNPGSIAAGDLNVDGQVDIIVANEDSNTVAALAGTGGGGLGAPVLLATGPNPDHLTLADLSGDGVLDIAVPNGDGSTVTVSITQAANFVSYCTAAPNSAGGGAQISATGSPSIAANTFSLTATGVPANKAGLFYFGAGATEVPFGAGFRCVSGETFRFGFAFSNGMGVANQAVDFQQFPGSVITPGSVWNFQYWYRDQAAMPAPFNLSNGVRVSFGS